jgi:hypothetical protein
MRRTVKRITFAGLLLLAICISYLVLSGLRAARVRDSLRKLTLGMSQTEVLSIAGSPTFTNHFINDRFVKRETWVYPHSLVAAEVPSCSFDEDSKRLIQVVVNESTRKGTLDGVAQKH